MLSICIPIYNVDVRELTKKLVEQASYLNISIEVRLYDDGSTNEYKTRNKPLAAIKQVVYFELPTNLGSAAIRNKMAHDAIYNSILFIDSDSAIPSNYLEVYIPFVNSTEPIVCGGRLHPKELPSSEVSLRWNVGKKREDFPAYERNIIPNRAFMSNNFLIRKDVFNKVVFNDKIPRSGYEDIMFGIELEKKNISITHIDNQVVHIGLETNKEFISKTKQRLETLKFLTDYHKEDALMIERIKVLKYFYGTIKRYRLNRLMSLTYSLFKTIIEKQLSSAKPSMFLYDIFKISYYSTL